MGKDTLAARFGPRTTFIYTISNLVGGLPVHAVERIANPLDALELLRRNPGHGVGRGHDALSGPVHTFGRIDHTADGLPQAAGGVEHVRRDHHVEGPSEALGGGVLLDVQELGAQEGVAARQPLLALSKRLAPDVSPECEQRLRAWVEVYYGGQVDELGWRMRPAETEERRQAS